MPDMTCGWGSQKKFVGINIPTISSNFFLKINPYISLDKFVGIISREIRLHLRVTFPNGEGARRCK